MVNIFRWPSEAVKLFLARSRVVKPASILVVLVIVSVCLVSFFRLLPPAPAIVIPLHNGIPTQKPTLPERWIPPTWGWLWRLKESVLGRRKVITLNTTIIDCEGLSNFVASALSLWEPHFTDTNGLQVWILGDRELDALRRRLERTPGNNVLSSPRVTTADGIEARLSDSTMISIDGTQRDAGVVVDFLPRFRRDVTDLFALISHSGAVTNQAATTTGMPQANLVAIRTNFAAAVRIQIPKGSGVFLLGNEHGVTNGKSIGVIISATLPPPKK